MAAHDTVLAHRSSAGEPEATVYFRRAFGVSASQLAAWGVMADARTGTAAPTVVARIIVDDAAVVYLNGDVVFSYQIPAGPGLPFKMYAEFSRGYPRDREFIAFHVPLSALRVGRNVIAVEMHAAQHEQPADLRFDLMMGVVLGAPLPCPAPRRRDSGSSSSDDVAVTRGPYLTGAAPTSMTIRWRTSVLSRTALRYAVAPSSYVPGVGVGVDAVPEVNWTVVNTDRCASIDQRVTLNQLRPHTRYLYQILPELPLSSSSRVPSRLLTAGDDSVTAVHSFITSPAVSDTRTALRAWFIGDSGTGTVRQTRVRDAYLAIRTRERRRDSFLFALGDNAYEWGTEHEVQAHFFDVYGRLLYDTPLWSAFGNHDFYGAKSPKRDGAYFIAFPMPGDGRAGGAPSNTSAFYRFEQAT